jgi:hypothetical protein
MYLLRASSLLRATVCLSFCLSILPSAHSQKTTQIRFRVVANAMIVVPVTINGAGPYDFLLDTGNSNTLVDRRLAEELHLPSAGERILVTAQGEAVTPRGHSDSLSMAGATVLGLDLLLINRYAQLLPGVRGSLGEDFLRNFDLLIDNEHRHIELEEGPGLLANRLTGEHLPMSLNGFNGKQLTRNRLVVAADVYELGNKRMKLQLDSGTPSFLLFSKSNAVEFTFRASSPHCIGGIFGDGFDAKPAQTDLKLGTKLFPNLTVLLPIGHIRSMDVDGLLPTSLFRTIFISHSGQFAILNPSAYRP